SSSPQRRRRSSSISKIRGTARMAVAPVSSMRSRMTFDLSVWAYVTVAPEKSGMSRPPVNSSGWWSGSTETKRSLSYGHGGADGGRAGHRPRLGELHDLLDLEARGVDVDRDHGRARRLRRHVRHRPLRLVLGDEHQPLATREAGPPPQSAHHPRAVEQLGVRQP